MGYCTSRVQINLQVYYNCQEFKPRCEAEKSYLVRALSRLGEH
jgi:hypothetical protein